MIRPNGRAAGRRAAAVAGLLAACSATTGESGGPTIEVVPPSTIEINVDADSMPIDPHIRGTNLPAWILPETLANADFRRTAVESGATLVRMPGGSWSNNYDWLGCELNDAESCFAPWASRPTDFVDFLTETGLDGMWTVAVNDSAQSAAAAVAFFNGTVGDRTQIGVDRNGVDWDVVDRWARLRAEHGHPEPVGIRLWEVGNEVYGGRPAVGGDSCASFGWEDVWTCDPVEYVKGNDAHDGFRDIRRAMLAVDPGIGVGIVGVAGDEEWNRWGPTVVEATAAAFDFYVVHDYGFTSSPEPRTALARPAKAWPETIAAARSFVPDDIPIAVTEYNLVAFQDGDQRATMSTALNALYVTETIGQMALQGVSIANQWNLGNGATETGADYGMIDLTNGRRLPQFHGFAAWADAGSRMLTLPSETDLIRVYPTTHDNGSLTLIVLNFGDEPVRQNFDISDNRTTTYTTRSRWASDAESTTMTIGTISERTVENGGVATVLPPWSVTVVHVGGNDG